ASVMASVQSAEQAYRRAEVSGDWRQAKQLYQELERSPLHHVRTTAQNRLEFIRQREGQPAPGPLPTGSNGGVGGMAGHRHDLYAGSWRPSTGEPRPGMNPGMQPGMAARTTMPPAGSPGTTWDRAASSGLPPEAPAPVQQPAVARPVNAPAAPRSVTPAPELAGVSRQPTIGPKWTPGLLRQAYQNLGGQPLFYLMDTNDQLKCFVSPGPGTDLRPFVNRNVEVMGGLLLPRVDLGNKPHMTVTAVRPLP
ncbi:MAG TPA: hypothetical protein PKD86_13565, partial [Gemmatales bacterium]|nr:hypothetical protein [Gemmatales bacterium]